MRNANSLQRQHTRSVSSLKTSTAGIFRIEYTEAPNNTIARSWTDNLVCPFHIWPSTAPLTTHQATTDSGRAMQINGATTHDDPHAHFLINQIKALISTLLRRLKNVVFCQFPALIYTVSSKRQTICLPLWSPSLRRRPMWSSSAMNAHRRPKKAQTLYQCV
jgi:hypothetical protein